MIYVASSNTKHFPVSKGFRWIILNSTKRPLKDNVVLESNFKIEIPKEYVPPYAL